jgi:hypothetical protein
MAIQLINIGQLANDGTGDDLRDAFIKVNQNFEELDLRQPESTTVTNLGATGEGIFSRKFGNDLQFKKLVAGSNITLASNDSAITVNASGGLQSLAVVSDSGSIILNANASLEVFGQGLIRTSISGNRLTISSDGSLSAPLDLNGQNLVNAGTLISNDVNSTVYGYDVREFGRYLVDMEFGTLTQDIQNLFDWIISETDVDLGTLDAPDARNLDFGLLVNN